LIVTLMPVRSNVRFEPGTDRENAMSNQEWWAAERKAAEFWRKVKENQAGSHGRNSLNHERGAAPITQPRASVARLLSQISFSRLLA
jgi:hypothetical protein